MAAGATRALQGLRTGDQRALFTGAALAAYGWLRSNKGGRELIYRKEVPVGSSVVIRHGKKGQLPEIEIIESGSKKH